MSDCLLPQLPLCCVALSSRSNNSIVDGCRLSQAYIGDVYQVKFNTNSYINCCVKEHEQSQLDVLGLNLTESVFMSGCCWETKKWGEKAIGTRDFKSIISRFIQSMCGQPKLFCYKLCWLLARPGQSRLCSYTSIKGRAPVAQTPIEPF